jgi:hypothetical protein
MPMKSVERAKGVEPLPKAWKTSILPLNYTRNLKIPSVSIGDNAPFGALFGPFVNI